MISPAWAQTGAAAAVPSFLVQMLPLLLIFGVFYFMLIRPQQQRAKQQEEMLSNLKRNDAVVTSGGIHGKVATIHDSIVEIEVAPNVRIRVDRPQIASVAAKPGSIEKSKDKSKEKEKSK